MLHCYLTTEMSRIFLHQPSLRKLKGLLHIQSYSTNWNNKPKKKENKPQNYPCFRDSSHVLCHATVWKGFLSTFLPMQGPTTQRQSKAQPEFTQPSSHVLHLLLLLCPILDGTKFIGGHFSNHFWKENISPVLAMN